MAGISELLQGHVQKVKLHERAISNLFETAIALVIKLQGPGFDLRLGFDAQISGNIKMQ